MIRPEAFAIESQGAGCERDNRDIFNMGPVLSRIETRDAPFFVRLFCASQDIDRPIDEHMSADLSTNTHNAENVSVRIEFQNAILVPLTYMKMLAVVAEI